MTDSVLELIESVRDYKVLFVGDSIIDEYHYVTPLQRAAKEYLIPMKFERAEVFSGGVDAAARHLNTFCKTVEIGSSNKPIRKVRFVDETLHKLAEVHYEDGAGGDAWPRDLNAYDCVVFADFGHGEIGNPNELSTAFRSVSTQTNAANRGFNLITKYDYADYIVIDEPEARLAAADRDGPIERVILKLAKDRCNKFVVTLGHKGAIGYDGMFYRQKAFTDLVRDTMGAGDAFFSITSPMAKTGKMEDLLFIGCAAGAIKTGIVGHRESVTKEKLIGFIKARS